jgi:hypothetical protein
MSGSQARQQRYTHSPEKWSSMRPVIERIYIGENKTADQLRSILKAEYNFLVGYAFIRQAADRLLILSVCAS